MTLSVVMITMNSADVVEGALKSISGIWDELLVGDGGSTDGTVETIKKYGAKVIQTNPTRFARAPARRANTPIRPIKRKNLGERKQWLVEKAKGDWILVLDADERVSEELKAEILSVSRRHSGGRRPIESRGDPIRYRASHSSVQDDRSIAAYRIQYQNYVFGRPVYYGGERYAKVRLFKKGSARISPEALHEEVMVKDGKVGELKGIIHHHSYRTPIQLFKKFTSYAWIAAREKKRQGETLSLEKLFLYAPHMFWARYIIEKGYRDGWRGLVLALAFGYMEGLTYWLIFIRHTKP